MNIKNKIVAAFALAIFVAPGISLAQTMSVAQLQAEIQSLTAQLVQLETQLAAAGGTTTTWCYTFSANLSIGMTGNAVTELQTALQKNGESVTVNGTFDDQTAAAVTGFQEKYASVILAPYGLSNGTGYVGTATRAELNVLFGCGGTTNPITPPVAVVSSTITILSPSAGGALTVGQSIPYQVEVGTNETMGAFNLGLASVNSGWPGASGTYVPLVGSNGYFAVPANGIYSGTAMYSGSLPPGNYYLYASWASRDGLESSYVFSNFLYTIASSTIISTTTPAQSVITVSPTALNFSATVGGPSPSSRTIAVNAPSNIIWNVSSTEYGSTQPNWLSLAGGGSYGSGSVTVSINSANLSAGTYWGVITISCPVPEGGVVAPNNCPVPGGASQGIGIPVALTVTGGETNTPTITLTAPASGAQWTEGTTHTITWTDTTPVALSSSCSVSLLTGAESNCTSATPKYDISYILPGGVQSIATAVPGTSYSWAIPSNLATASYAIKVCATGTTFCGTSNSFSVVALPNPTVTISASPAAITQGSSTEITWSSTYAASCNVSGSGLSSTATSSAQAVIPTATGTLSYGITCKNVANVSAVASAAVVVTPKTVTTIVSAHCSNASPSCQTQVACQTQSYCKGPYSTDSYGNACTSSDCSLLRPSGCSTVEDTATWVTACNGTWTPTSTVVTSMNTPALQKENQTAIIAQSLQNILSKVGALFKSL